MAHAEKCGLLIHRIHNYLEKSGNSQLGKKGLTFSQMNVLINLSESPEGVSFKELEKRLKLAQSTTVGLISRLEEKGLVSVFDSHDDKRVKFVRITEKGELYRSDAEDEMNASEEKLLSPLTEIEGELLYSLLKKISGSFPSDS